MSFVDPSQDPNQDPDENQSQVDQAMQSQAPQGQQPDQPSATPPATSGGGGAGIVSGGGVGGTASISSASGGAAKPSSSGAWTNLNSYLDANKDQAAGVGAQVASGINQKGQAAQDEIGNLNTGFNQDVQNNTVNEDSGSVNQAIQDASSIQPGASLSQADLDNFKKQATASYGGPTNLTQYNGYSQAANDAQQAITNAQQAQTEAGRDVLLQNQYQNASANGYTQGENNLDQLLLEGGGGGEQLNKAASQWTGLNDALNSDVTSGNAAAATAAANTAQTSADALSAFNTGRTGANTQVQSYLDNQKANYSNDYNGLVDSLNKYSGSGGGNLSLNAQQAQQLGLTADQRLYDLYQASPTLGSQYLNQASFDAAKEITPQQQAELAALDQLGLAGGQAATNRYTDPSLAGTQNATNSIDTSGFNQAVANANQAYTSAAAQDLTGTGTRGFNYGYNTNAVKGLLGETLVPASYINVGDGTSGQYGAIESLSNYLNKGGLPSSGSMDGGGGFQSPDTATLMGSDFLTGATNTNGTNYNSQYSDAVAAAKQDAEQSLWNQIQNEIKTSGYTNQVKIA